MSNIKQAIINLKKEFKGDHRVLAISHLLLRGHDVDLRKYKPSMTARTEEDLKEPYKDFKKNKRR